jgi:lauroyl/myristoyl acyltransferase
VRLRDLRLAPDGLPRPDAPFGQGPMAARVLRLAILGASALASRLPATVVYPLARLGGTLEWALRPRKRAMLAQNLCHALGLPPDHAAVRRLVRREVLNEARRSADFLWALGRGGELVARTEIAGLDNLRAALAAGRGAILAGLHVGGWEVVGPVPRAIDIRTNVIVTDDWLAWAVAELREDAGLRVIYDHEPSVRTAERLRAGEAVLMLGDYAKPTMRIHRVRLLDGDADLPAGPAALARLCGSPIVPFSVLPGGTRRWRVEIEPPIEPPLRSSGDEGEQATLQALADRWTSLLRRHAEHWAAVYPIKWYAA